MNYNNFDQYGEQVGEYFLTVSIQDLKDMSKNAEKKVVLVAGGLHKFEAIKTALATRMFNTLVTDHRTAQKLTTLSWPGVGGLGAGRGAAGALVTAGAR